MATTAITPTELVLNTVSADILDAGGTVATTPADGWVITPTTGFPIEHILLKFLADGTGDTVTIAAGTNPPAQLAGLGALAIVLAASDVRYIVVEAARFDQGDGTLLATCVDAGTTCKAFAIPGGGGAGHMNP